MEALKVRLALDKPGTRYKLTMPHTASIIADAIFKKCRITSAIRQTKIDVRKTIKAQQLKNNFKTSNDNFWINGFYINFGVASMRDR